MQNDIPDWLKDIAQKVHDLTRQSHVLDRFHAMMKQWRATLDDQRAEQDKWRVKRKRHFEELAKFPDDHPERTQSGKPPTRGWTWEGDDFMPSPGTRIFGWVSPELSHNAEPKVDLILPALDRKNRTDEKPLRLEEKYTLLAAVHDYALMGVEKINPWPWPHPVSSQEDFAARIEAIPYAALFYGPGGELPEDIADAEHELRTFLADVEADLKANAPDPVGAEETTRDMSKPKNHFANLKTWVYAHKILVWIIAIVIALTALGGLVKVIIDIVSFFRS